MKNLIDYIETAKINSGSKSDRKLGAILGLSEIAVSNWRNKRSFPSDEVMEKLAIMAGVDPTEALIDLNIWRTTGRAQLTYQKIRTAIMTGTTACFAILICFSPSPAAAEKCNLSDVVNVYYGKRNISQVVQKIKSFLAKSRHTMAGLFYGVSLCFLITQPRHGMKSAA